jgi:hypothetical protein
VLEDVPDRPGDRSNPALIRRRLGSNGGEIRRRFRPKRAKSGGKSGADLAQIGSNLALKSGADLAQISGTDPADPFV